jgi:Tol biopolymer transport system component
MINISVTSISLRVDGPWQVKVDLPAFTNGADETEVPTGCLTYDSWKAALGKTDSLPSGLTGTLVMKAISDTDGTYHVYIVNLANGQREDIGKGNDPSISPDGKTIIFNTENGLVKIDVQTKETVTLPNTGKRDRGAVFSPDGTRIAFTRGPESGMNNAAGPYSIYLANPDGSDQRPLLENSDANTALAWMPDGKSLLYAVKNPLGASLRLIDVATGQTTDVIETNYVNSGAVVSPDGQMIAYEDQMDGEQYAIYAAAIDGGGKHLIANTSPLVTTHPQWSPDGKWLAVSVQDTDLSEMNAVIALVNVDTCEIVAIPSLAGYITGWLP